MGIAAMCLQSQADACIGGLIQPRVAMTNSKKRKMLIYLRLKTRTWMKSKHFLSPLGYSPTDSYVILPEIWTIG